MRPVTARLVAVTAVSESAYATPQIAVAIPPTEADAAAGLIRVDVNGQVITRAYDPDLEQP